MTVKKITFDGTTVKGADVPVAIQRVLGIHTSPEKVHDLECVISILTGFETVIHIEYTLGELHGQGING